MKGKLTLIPTPIDDRSFLTLDAKETLLNRSIDSIICVEEHKTARRRWLHYGLPREDIDKFVLYNEHSRDKLCEELIVQLKQGQDVYLMSDCGLPAFCDPGKELVNSCHENNILVTATSFHNSTLLALALSGFNHDEFYFKGFLSANSGERQVQLKELLKEKQTIVLMDTPYRYKKIISDLRDLNLSRPIFVGLDLNGPNEFIYRGNVSNCPIDKKEPFVLIIK